MKLTAEQKEINKEMSLLRQVAYRARTQEMDVALLGIDTRSLKDAAAKACAVENAALAARNNEVTLIQQQIAALQEKIHAVKVSHALSIVAANKVRSNAYQDLYTENQRQRDVILSSFPDMEGKRYSGVTGWTPPEGYIENYAVEHADELQAKKAKREKAKEK
jgi:hypothetical protein